MDTSKTVKTMQSDKEFTDIKIQDLGTIIEQKCRNLKEMNHETENTLVLL